jgi:hypothetical protein
VFAIQEILSNSGRKEKKRHGSRKEEKEERKREEKKGKEGGKEGQAGRNFHIFPIVFLPHWILLCDALHHLAGHLAACLARSKAISVRGISAFFSGHQINNRQKLIL